MQPDDLADAVIDVIDGAVTPLRERLAVLETRCATFADAVHSDRTDLESRLLARIDALERTAADQATRVAVIEQTTLPGPPGPPGPPGRGLFYRGTWRVDTDYVPGDIVTSGGSAWHAQEPTRHRPGEHPSWQLMVQRGKAGRNADRDGKA